MKIMTPSGEKAIELRKGDDPQRAAESFVRMHHIPTQKISKIFDAIMSNIEVETLPGGGGYSAIAAKQTIAAAAAPAAPAPRRDSAPGNASDSSTSSVN